MTGFKFPRHGSGVRIAQSLSCCCLHSHGICTAGSCHTRTHYHGRPHEQTLRNDSVDLQGSLRTIHNNRLFVGRLALAAIAVATVHNLLPSSVALFVYTSRLTKSRIRRSTLHLSILLKSPGLRLSPWSPPRTVLLSTMAAQGHPAAGLDALLAAVASENGLHHGLGNMAPSLRSLMNHSPQVGRLDMAPEHGWPTRIAIC
jgi:hypothetical protein